MSQIPPPYDPLSYAVPSVPTPSLRPTSVTVIAIIAIIFGGLGTLGGICLAPQAFGINLAGTPNPVLDAMKKDTALMAFNEINHVVGAVLSVLELVAAIGLLSLKLWSRKLMVIFAVLDIIVIILSVAANVLFVQAHMAKIMTATFSSMPGMNAANAQTMGAIMKIGMAAGPCMMVFVLIWPALIIYFLTRPAVKAAFEGGPPPGTPGI